MSRQLFVNLPVADLGKAVGFFTDLGFAFNAQFTDDTSMCMLVGEQAFVMLLQQDRCQEFTVTPTADARAPAASRCRCGRCRRVCGTAVEGRRSSRPDDPQLPRVARCSDAREAATWRQVRQATVTAGTSTDWRVPVGGASHRDRPPCW